MPNPFLSPALGLCLAGQSPKEPPRLRVEPPGQVDLGALGPREPRDQAYRFLNVSAAPIALRLLDLSPGVTVQGPALQGPIPAGGAAALTLTLDPAGWQGLQTRNVRLGTDDPGQGNYYLPVQVRIRPDLTVDALRGDFGDAAVFESPERSFRFTRETGEPLALRIATPLPPYLEAELEPGRTWVLRCTFHPARVEPGVRLGLERIRVETNAPLQPAFDLYLSWRLHHPIEAEPARVVIQDPDTRAQELRLKAGDGRPFAILGATVEGEGFKVVSSPAGEAPEHTLTVRCEGPRGARAMLVLTFTGQDAPLRVPLAYLPSH